ncbi:beclin 1-associated autophagy-related key regulator [Lutzomyia longipalpis]|uniref:Putative beclin 1-associated autophagy-related key regulator n=1 Tax=Lutzomyia longipalpis TaxID=7200 RepID=A0A7G3AA90_LUTLO|nr:beclin 1-associated autophagy-related key regulator [Lutzomyia longipalpis]
MAGSNNSDDSNRAPENFHLSSSNEGTESLGQSAKCPLCLNQARAFYCCDCLTNGDFHSKKNWSNERFAEKKIHWLNQQSNSKTMEIKCGHLMQKHSRAEGLRTRIKLKEQRVTLLKKQIADIRSRMESGQKELTALNQRNKELQRTLPRYGYKVRELDDYVTNKLSALDKHWADHIAVRTELKKLIRSSISRLIHYIFPIERSVRESASGQSTAKELADATHTAYIRGQWVLQDSLGEVQHTIVAPYLPGNGDYSAYCDWVATHKDGVPANTSDKDTTIDHNPAFRISAALTYTAQLVQVLSYYLDVTLPFKMSYSDFCSSYMNESSFNRRVARLNANIFFLCYAQRVRLSDLNPMHTIENIQTLLQLEHSDLGWMGHMEPTNTPTKSVESLLKIGLECGNDSESEDENSFPYEWEAVPHLSPLDVASPTPSVPTAQNPLQTASLVTSAAASIASIWRGWTAQK